MQETWVQFLGQEDPLEKEMATHSSILIWRIPLTEEPGELQCMGSQRVGHDWATNTCTFTHPKDVIELLTRQPTTARKAKWEGAIDESTNAMGTRVLLLGNYMESGGVENASYSL